LRRVRGKKNKESVYYKIGRFVFDTQKQLLSIDDRSTKLTTKEKEEMISYFHQIISLNFGH
ncbi:hypothetical protein EZS27_031248, partial [termite gut metagenome]